MSGTPIKRRLAEVHTTIILDITRKLDTAIFLCAYAFFILNLMDIITTNYALNDYPKLLEEANPSRYGDTARFYIKFVIGIMIVATAHIFIKALNHYESFPIKRLYERYWILALKIVGVYFLLMPVTRMGITVTNNAILLMELMRQAPHF